MQHHKSQSLLQQVQLQMQQPLHAPQLQIPPLRASKEQVQDQVMDSRMSLPHPSPYRIQPLLKLGAPGMSFNSAAVPSTPLRATIALAPCRSPFLWSNNAESGNVASGSKLDSLANLNGRRHSLASFVPTGPHTPFASGRPASQQEMDNDRKEASPANSSSMLQGRHGEPAPSRCVQTAATANMRWAAITMPPAMMSPFAPPKSEMPIGAAKTDTVPLQTAPVPLASPSPQATQAPAFGLAQPRLSLLCNSPIVFGEPIDKPTASRNQENDRTKELLAKMAELEAEKQKWMLQKEEMQAKIGTQSANIDRFQSHMAESDVAQRAVKKLEINTESLRLESRDLTMDLDNARIEVALLKAENARVKVGFDTLQTQHEDVQAELEKTEARLAEFQAASGNGASKREFETQDWKDQFDQIESENRYLKVKVKDLCMQYDASRMLNEELRFRLGCSLNVSPQASQMDMNSIRSGANSPSNRSCTSTSSLIPPRRVISNGRIAGRTPVLSKSSKVAPPRPATATRTSMTPPSKIGTGDKPRIKLRKSLPISAAKPKVKTRPEVEEQKTAAWWQEETEEFEKIEASVQGSPDP